MQNLRTHQFLRKFEDVSLEIDRSLNSLSLMSPRVSDHIRSQVSLAAVWHLLGDCNVSRGAQGRFDVNRKLEINTVYSVFLFLNQLVVFNVLDNSHGALTYAGTKLLNAY